ncbi:Alpha/Beta hydrolase protein [Glomus cerebriforme]|uniref:Alpha/Beta hydrolase protein n=1 Tax=Glomus cerebriforme TaxID=658196 RepID=A0A397SGW5_9GLOM|nr:Alpha/Beta hydrolase protein [Glomus cerebriforme]
MKEASPLLTYSVWTSYALINFLLAFLADLAQWPPRTWNFWFSCIISTIGTIFTEFPLYVILFKVWMWFAIAIMDVWFAVPIIKSSLIRMIMFILDIFTMSILLYNFYNNYKTRQIILTQTLKFKHYGPELPRITSSKFWLNIMPPLHIPLNIKVFRDITYGTQQELRQVGKENESCLKLDIYVPKYIQKIDSLPIMLFIHGGNWMSMDKLIPFPQPWYLSSNNWIVCSINYRLAPKNPYPACLIDCKRALRWIKENIVSYGGNPSFIAVSGDSAGGHLAALMALTANDKRYQPGFEYIDTKVQACVGINGIYDVTNKHNVFVPSFIEWFALKICGKSGDMNEKGVWEMLEDASPEVLVKRKGNLNEEIVPFLIIHGDNDQLVNIKSCREFVKTFRINAPNSKLIFIEFPGAHHGYHFVSSPRTHYSMIAMLRFLNWAYHTSNNITLND